MPVSAIAKLQPVMPTSARRKRGPQLRPRERRQLLRAGAELVAGDAREELAHLALRLVDDRRDHVARPVAVELDDVFAEVGLDHLDPGLLEHRVQLELLAQHRLRLHDQLRLGCLADAGHDPVRLGRVGGEVDVRAGRLAGVGEPADELGEVRHGVRADVTTEAPQAGAVVALEPLPVVAHGAVDGVRDRRALKRLHQLLGGALLERRSRQVVAHSASASSEARWSARTCEPFRDRRPPRWSRQPPSPDTSASTPACSTSASFESAIATDTSG